MDVVDEGGDEFFVGCAGGNFDYGCGDVGGGYVG